MAGQNYGLRGVSYVRQILIPAAFRRSRRPQDRLGLRLAHAHCRGAGVRRVVAFGRLGWFIFENRNQIETAHVFAGLTTVIIIDLLVESVVFRTVETHTVRKWGMQR